MALRRKKYVAQTREILAKTRRKVTEALTAGGNGYVSLCSQDSGQRSADHDGYEKSEAVCAIDDQGRSKVSDDAARCEGAQRLDQRYAKPKEGREPSPSLPALPSKSANRDQGGRDRSGTQADCLPPNVEDHHWAERIPREPWPGSEHERPH